MWTAEHGPLEFRLLTFSGAVEKISGKASTRLYEEVEGGLRRGCPGGDHEWMTLPKCTEALWHPQIDVLTGLHFQGLGKVQSDFYCST